MVALTVAVAGNWLAEIRTEPSSRKRTLIGTPCWWNASESCFEVMEICPCPECATIVESLWNSRLPGEKSTSSRFRSADANEMPPDVNPEAVAFADDSLPDSSCG